MQKIQTQENLIINSINNRDEIALAAFEKLLERFSDEDSMNSTCHIDIIRSIYIETDDKFIWQIAVRHNISERTLFRYRHLYINWFNYYYKKLSKAMEMAA